MNEIITTNLRQLMPYEYFMIDDSIYFHICTAIDNEYVYFFSPYSGCLFSVSRTTGEIKPVICVRMKRDFEYRALFTCGNKLYLLPYNSNVMKVIDKGETSCLDVAISTDDEELGITGCIKRDNILFLYGKRDYIATYNVVTGETSILNIDEKKLIIQHEMKNCFWTDSYLTNGMVYIPTVYNEIIVIDQNNQLNYIKLEDSCSDILQNNICITQNDIYSLYTDKDMTSWAGVYSFDGAIKKKKKIIIDKTTAELPFYTATLSNDAWIVFPAEANNISFIGEKIKKESLKRRCTVFNAKRADDKVFAIDCEHGELITVDIRTERIDEIELWMDSIAEKKMNYSIGEIIMSKNACVNESQVYTLNRFIECL